MRILIWGRGIDFNLIIKNVMWKNDVEVIGFLESKKINNTFEYENKILPVYEPGEIRSVKYDFILIANGFFAECLLISEKNGIDIEKIIAPYYNDIIKDKDLIMSKCSECMENAIDVIKTLNRQHHYCDKKKVLLYGDGIYLWQFLSAAFGKSGVEIIGIVTTTHSIYGYIKIFGREVKVFEQSEIQNLEFDMMLILDKNALGIFAEFTQIIDKNKMIIPFMTGIEENKYELIQNLLPYFGSVEYTISSMSAFHTSNERPTYMTYDILNYTLFSSGEYKKLGDLHYPFGSGASDYARIRTWELLIEEIKLKNVKGEVAELGVFQGDSTKVLKYYFPEKELYLYDTFEGFDKRDYKYELEEKNFTETWMQIFKETSLEEVQKFVGIEENIHYRKGYFPESIREEDKQKKFCFVSLDADMYMPTLAGLQFFYPRLESGGYIVIHEYNAIIMNEGSAQKLLGVKKAVRDFEVQYGQLRYVPIADRNGSIVITK